MVNKVNITNFSPVWEEDGGSEVAGYSAQHVYDADPQPTGQLLKISQNRHLKERRQKAVENSVV